MFQFFPTLSHDPDEQDQGTTLLERAPAALKPPSLYQVVLLNDDYTPMEFVVHVLQNFFSKTMDEATAIMLKIHTEGRGVCGVYSKDIATTKADRVIDLAQENGHPLQALIEPIDI